MSREFNNINFMSSSSNWTSTHRRSLIEKIYVLIQFQSLFHFRAYSFFFKNNLFMNDLDMCLLSNLNHITAGDSSCDTLLCQPNNVFSSYSFQSTSFIPLGIFQINAFTKPYYTIRSLTLLCHNLKFWIFRTWVYL